MSDLIAAIPNRIRALRMERGWTLAELAKRADTTPPQVMRIERSDRQLTLAWVERFAKAFGISPAELAFDLPSPRVIEVPLVGDIRAGNWQEAVERSDEKVPVPDSLAGSPRTFALRVQGNSMDLLIPDHGIVIVDPEDADLHDGKTYAVMNDEGETTVKRYRTSPSRLEPVSSDPAHKVIALGRAAFTVVGRVTGVVIPM